MTRAKVAFKNRTGVQVNIYYKPEATTIIAECDAITAMNSYAGAENKPLAARFWNHSTSFTSPPIILNFFEKFRGLARAYHEGQFEGSGKTITAMRIVAAVISGPVGWCKIPSNDDDDSADNSAKDVPGVSRPEPEDDAAHDEIASVHSEPKHTSTVYSYPEDGSGSDDSFVSAKDRESAGNVRVEEHPVATPWNTTEPDLPINVWETSDEGLVVAPVTKYDDPPALVYQIAPGSKSEADDTDIVTLDESATAKSVWTVGHDKLAHDVTLRAAKACHGKIIARILPWKREFANLLREGEAKPRVTAPANVALARHNDAFTARKFYETRLT
ncbi:hypothetical protein NW762_003594 [Fusarium torreyae]|uniref:Uncharacterized protein n=1 Tax=Fusarium torreyae TaxID=1237075 RepID=A0A9W8VJ82_9HYPO|nr:hypothetical protein NW762_003594 [Fusarium torreyae]